MEYLRPDNLLNQFESARILTQTSLDKADQVEFGQYFTSAPIAKMMAGMFQTMPVNIKILDPGAGFGTLTAAFISHCLSQKIKPKSIQATLFEVDHKLISKLSETLRTCNELCNQEKIDFSYTILNKDFIEDSVKIIQSKDSLFKIEQPEYNISILNPPYRKILSTSRTRQLLSSIAIETTNLYSAFVWLVSKLLQDDGQMVAIVPRSFCNGTYFYGFRKELTTNMNILRIHNYDSRDKAFSDGGVLQENIIFYAQKGKKKPSKVIISHNSDPDDENILIQETDYEKVINPKDPNMFIRIEPNSFGGNISGEIDSLPATLKDLGLSVSTGRVVDFRAKSWLRMEADTEIIPLIYPMNLKNGEVVWPIKNEKKAQYLSSCDLIEKLVIPSQNYVLVKRFSSKEEKKRIYASFFNGDEFAQKRIAIENHINIFHRNYGNLPSELAKGLTVFLNSTLVDFYFRQFSGHTQINAGDLLSLKYPSESQLISLGNKIGDIFDDQELIDKIVREELSMKNPIQYSGIDKPIYAKRKVVEALKILSMLSVPRAQQNDRSALTLLALANLKPTQEWSEASKNLIGITEMMDYFRENYGANYAPNTRETVRRQTIHQFIQLGFVIENPDNPDRPINSPHTRYIIEPNLLSLLQSFGDKEWNKNLLEYVRKSSKLSNLTIRERNIPTIPVCLPDGGKILLSSGGQNNLIKDVIEQFCPRYTPGGKVIYVGDAGNKISDQELIYFNDLGFKIDRHGKMPDVVVYLEEKQWIILIEAVTSHGPINLKRHNELRDLFSNQKYGLVFVTSFETRKTLNRFLSEISWETEVWTAEAPDHLIHFNGDKFLGPYST
jgi:adenine-specific DNA-methyltransferase